MQIDYTRARRVLALCPGVALAHWLRATVFIARESFDNALEELRAGTIRFPANVCD